MTILCLGPIICKTTEEKKQILKEFKEEDSKDPSRPRRHEVLTVDELIEINKHFDYSFRVHSVHS
jgi:hypothetical protein